MFDPATDKDTATDEAVTITNGKASLANAPLLAPVAPVVTNGGGTTTYVLGTDYILNEYGALKMIPSGDISEGDGLLVTYNFPDSSSFAAADFIGANSPRTGMKLFAEAFDTFGFNPKIIICPEYSSIEAVAVEMTAQMNAFRAVGMVDDVKGTVRADLVSHRTSSGNSFNSVSRRVIPCAPWHYAYNYKGVLTAYPLSSWAAGIMALTDKEEGYWTSPSNHTIEGIGDPEWNMIGTGINDKSSDANLLNAAGVVTTLKVGGSRRAWGNRSAAHPSDSDVRNFIPIQRTSDIVTESLELAKLPYMDKPIIQATINAIRGTANAFIATLIQRGGLLAGSKVVYDPADNPATELAAGHVQFRFIYMPPTPTERITYLSFIDISLLTNLA